MMDLIKVTDKKKKLYEKPAMEVLELKRQSQLLVGSSQSSLRDYGWYEEFEGTGVQNYNWNSETEE